MTSLATVGAGPSGAADPYAGYLVYDSFDDDDDTALTGHAPEKDDVGSGWQTGLSGTWNITSNKAYQSAGANAAHTVYIDTGVSDFTVECVVNCGTAVAAGLIVRAKDGDDNLEIILDPGGDRVRVYENIGGARAHLSTVSMTIDVSTDYNVRVVLSADSVKVYIDDMLKNDITETTHQTETGVGLWTWDASADARWNDLTVE